MLDSGGSGLQLMGDLCCGDVAGMGVAVKVGVEWSVWRGSVVVKMEDALLASIIIIITHRLVYFPKTARRL